MIDCSLFPSVCRALSRRPQAIACMHGSDAFPQLCGEVRFYQCRGFVVIAAEVCGLPDGFYGFHIHTGSKCAGIPAFADSGGHYNPANTDHPNHAGDLPVLLSSGGAALLVFQTQRFRLRDVIDRTVIVHNHPDDYRTQPSGDSGDRIACGVIRRCI